MVPGDAAMVQEKLHHLALHLALQHHTAMLPCPRFTRAHLLGNVHFDPRWPVIGPHEGRAAWLMALGWKPAAYFCDSEDFDPCDDEQALMALADAGIVERHVFRRPGLTPSRYCFNLREAIYVLPDRGDLVAALRKCIQGWALRLPDLGYRSEHAFGSALGYGPADIRAFIWRLYG